jgi:hypothetical protein
MTVDHVDGHPDHSQPSNLQWLCKSCNTAKGAAFAKAGKGRLTNQYNPSGGAETIGQWMNAIGAIVPHEHPERNETLRAGTTMSTADAVAMIRATSPSKRRDFAAKLRRHNPWPFSPDASQRTPAHGGIAFHQGRKKPSDQNAEFLKKGSGAVTRYKGYTISRTQDGEFFSSLDRDSTYSTKAQVQRAIDSYQKGRGNPTTSGKFKRPYRTTADWEFWLVNGEVYRNEKGNRGYATNGVPANARWESSKAHFDRFFDAVYRKNPTKGDKQAVARALARQNPAHAAAAGYEDFHGHPSKEVVTVSKKIHHHAHLAAAGELKGLSVRPIGHGLPVRTIGGLKGAILAFNENKNQLFIEGGDQYLSDAELRNFGIKKPHEIETLGKVVALDYFTSKSHLGSEGGTAVYAHKLRTTNENGRHVTVVIARYPDLIYRVLDQQLEFSGGSYEIRAEGIDK